MKKIFSAAILTLFAVMLCGCANKTEKADKAESQAASSVQTETTTTRVRDRVPVDTTETTADEAEHTTVKKSPSGTVKSPYIKDNAAILSDEDIQVCDQVISEISSSRMMNAAVVTTDDLGGNDAYAYAAKCYNEIFGADKNNGLLFLINNDTDEDILYKSGITAVDPNAEKEAFYRATQEIVSGRYGEAAAIMLRLGESVPSHIFDRAGFFTPQQISDLDKAAEGYASELSLCIVGSLATAEPDIAKALCQKRYPDKNGVMLIVDGSGKTSVYSDTDIPSELKNAAPAAAVSNTDGLYTFLTDLLKK